MDAKKNHLIEMALLFIQNICLVEDMGLDARKPVFRGGADQPARMCSLISAFLLFA